MKNLTTILLPAWDKMLSTHGLSAHIMPQDISTCWNSTFDMLEFAIWYHITIDAMTTVCEFNLWKYELVPDEWSIAMELCDVLRVSNCISLFFLTYSCYSIWVFKDATLYFSYSTPNLATVIPAMDFINDILTMSSESSQRYSLMICVALTIRKRTLSKYYNKTGVLKVYYIAMSTFLHFYIYYMFLTAILVLHPCHKLEYFRKNNWDEPSIEAACDIIQDVFDETYCGLDIDRGNGTMPRDANTVVSHSDLHS